MSSAAANPLEQAFRSLRRVERIGLAGALGLVAAAGALYWTGDGADLALLGVGLLLIFATLGFGHALYPLHRHLEEQRDVERQLLDRQVLFRQLEDSSREVFYQCEWPSGRMLYVSPAFSRLWDRPVGEYFASRDQWLDSIAPEDHERVSGRWLEEAETGRFDEVYRLIRPDGSDRWIHDRAFPALDASGAVYRIVGLAEDVTAQARSERALEAANVELERSNADLEVFAFATSHDLQEPLRAIGGFATLLARRSEAALDDDGRQHLRHIVEGVERMRALVAGLLAYARLDSQGTAEWTDAEQVLRDLLADLGPETQGAVAPRSTPLPAVWIPRAALSQVLRNLLINASKFQREDAKPRILVSAKRGVGEWIFSVRDNGIGIPPEHHERIFDLYHRLHGRGRYPGSGLGLAMCKRVIDRCGGRIWVESEIDRGACFYFTILDAKEER